MSAIETSKVLEFVQEFIELTLDIISAQNPFIVITLAASLIALEYIRKTT